MLTHLSNSSYICNLFESGITICFFICDSLTFETDTAVSYLCYKHSTTVVTDTGVGDRRI